MIYLDNAATTLHKPRKVIEAVNDCLLNYCANPGRGGHKLSLIASRAVYSAREEVAGFFNIGDPFRVIFTSGATESLNLAIKGLLKDGGHVVTTSMEHNSVMRPLSALGGQGVTVSIVDCAKDGSLDVRDIEAQISPDTKLIACTHASNLTGTVMPIKEIGGICRKNGLIFLVDAAQSAGVLDIDVADMNIDLLAVPGHKGLMGMPGAGFLYIGERAEVGQLKEGGTGSSSDSIVQPLMLPDRYESGTLNLPGIVSIEAGLRFIKETGIENIRRHEENLTKLFIEGLRSVNGVTVYSRGAGEAPVAAFNLESISSAEVAFMLDDEFDICTRAGLHCAPYAHKTVGTMETGAVRASFGFFNTEGEIQKAVDAISKITGGGTVQ